MGRKYTPFERDVVASILWQLKGYRGHEVGKAATSRILRATLRRIHPVHIGRSTQVRPDSKVELDHVVPISVISGMLMEMDDVSEIAVMAKLEKYLTTAELTNDEHRVLLKPYGSRMPKSWDASCQDPQNHLARYIAVGIATEETSEVTKSRKRDQGNADKGDSSRERFPLRKFYDFAKENDLGEDAMAIKETVVPPAIKKRAQTIFRGRAISLLEEEGKLDEFIRQSWKFGLSPKGRSEMRSCKNLARRFECGEW